MIPVPFTNRLEAGVMLAGELAHHHFPKNTVVLALARGGVPIGFEVAERLGLPLEVIVARKLGVPWQPELAMGAIAGTARVLDRRLIEELGISTDEIHDVLVAEAAEMKRREAFYREGRAPVDITHHTVIVVDDGVATGNTLIAAIRHARNMRALRVNVAVPVGSSEGCVHIRHEAEGAVCICLNTPHPFVAVSHWYGDFPQVGDDEVRNLLAESWHSHPVVG
jgi:predicted phosphoribosyltransferase